MSPLPSASRPQMHIDNNSITKIIKNQLCTIRSYYDMLQPQKVKFYLNT